MDPLDAQATDENNDPTGADTQPDESAPSGVQARIDELVGKFRGMERVVAEKDQQISQLTSRLLDMTGQRAPEADPLDAMLKDTDPEDVKRVSAIVERAMKPFAQRIEQLTGQLHESRAGNALAQVQDPEVRQRAQRLIDGWRKQGVFGSVATERDAILMARGMVAEESESAPQRAERERIAFNGNEPPLSSVRAAPAGRNQTRRNGIDLTGLDAEALAEKLRANPGLEDQLGDFEL